MGDTYRIIAPTGQKNIQGSTLKKIRVNARGKKKVKSGCQTCKIRHKKCDESKPACTPCRSAGHRCEFIDVPQGDANTSCSQEFSGISTQAFRLQRAGLPTSLPNHMFFLTDFEAMHFDYFRRVCARDFALLFESSLWESILVQAAYAERSLFHAALATSVLTRATYSPVQDWHDPESTGSAVGYTTVQYNRAIKCLNARLRSGVNCTEIAILGSILFIAIEGFQGYRAQMFIHLRGGLALLESLKASSPDTEYLKTALHHIQNQVQMFEG